MYNPSSKLLVALVVAIVVAFPSALSAQSVELQMIVSVLDKNNQPVMGLQPDDFLVREDQAVREVLRVSQNPTGRQIALLVDTSAYVEDAVRDFRLGLNALIETLYQGNEISLISYGGPPRILVEATGSRSRLEAGVGQIFSFASSAAYLLDAMRETAQGFARRKAARPMMVVLTTEGLDHSNADSSLVLRSLKEAGVALYTVVLRENALSRVGGSPLARWRIERDLALSRGPALNGGRRRDLLTSMGTESAMREIATEIRNQYLVVYSRPNMLIPPEQIEVDVTRDGMRARGTPVHMTPVINVMRRVLPLVVLGLSVAAVATSEQQCQDTDRSPQTPAFCSNANVVSLNVTVTDGNGRFVMDLIREAFAVCEDGGRCSPMRSGSSTAGSRLSPWRSCMDTSASMDEEMTTAQEAAIGFSRRLRPEDLAEIIDFDSRVDILQGFTNDVELLEKAIGRTSAGGSTALYNALYISLKELKRAPVSTEEVRREAIVVRSDGEDTSSLVTFEEVLELAKRSETAIYTIGLKVDDNVRGQGSSKPTSCCASSLTRPVDDRCSPRGSKTCPRSTSRSRTSCPASTPWGTPQATHCGTGSGDRSSCVLTGTR